jgi:hypothetical protein
MAALGDPFGPELSFGGMAVLLIVIVGLLLIAHWIF